MSCPPSPTPEPSSALSSPLRSSASPASPWSSHSKSERPSRRSSGSRGTAWNLSSDSTSLRMRTETSRQSVPTTSQTRLWPDQADSIAHQTQIEDEGDAEAYFEDLQNSSAGPSAQVPADQIPPRPTSPSGYLRRSGVDDEMLGTKPEWTMPIVVQGGVWDMIKAVGKWKGEGWASLWKGQSRQTGILTA